MDLYKRLEEDSKVALKAGDSVKLSVLRMLLSSIKMLEIEKNIKTPSDSDVLPILQRHIKQHKESIEQFKKGNRQDLADKEEKELKILSGYMPEQMTEGELLGIVKDAVAQTGAVAKSDMGKVMKVVMEKARGKADGKVINQLVMRFLK